MNKTTQKAYLLFALVCLVWGTTWMAAKITLQYLPPYFFLGSRECITGVLLLLFFLCFKKQPFPNWGQWRLLLLQSLCFIVIGTGFGTLALQYMDSGVAGFMPVFVPVAMLLVAPFFQQDMYRRCSTIIGLLLCTVGACLVFYRDATGLFNSKMLFGIGLNCVGIFGWCIGTLLNIRHTSHKNIITNPYYSLGWQMLIGGIVWMLISLFTKEKIQISEVAMLGWASYFYIIIVGSIIVFAAYLYAIQHLPVAVSSLYAYISPLIALSVGIVFLHEIVTGYMLFGVVVTLIGIYFVNRKTKQL